MTAERLDRSGSHIIAERRTPHAVEALAPAIAELAPQADMLILFGASATSDPQDIVPAAIAAAGGQIIRVGMPVDPGNLLTLATIGGKPVLGAPGCARSPKENGFDWVLDRLSAGLTVTATDIAELGVGGLLMEIESRPQPRDISRRKPASPLPVHGILMAAGSSSRMGGPNKLLAKFDGVPLVRRAAETLLAGGVAGLTAVTGHDREDIEAALDGLGLTLIHNPGYASGLSSSLRAGIAALPPEAAGALIGLADMPKLAPRHIHLLLDRFAQTGGTAVIRACHGQKPGNPVILPRSLFEYAARIEGDRGARDLIASGNALVVEVDLGEAASFDVDTPDRMAEAGGEVG